MYLYRRIDQFEFCDDFRRVGWPRRFSKRARMEIYLHLQGIAEMSRQPIEVDYAGLVGRFYEYRRVADALAEHYPLDRYDALSRWWSGELSVDEARRLLADWMTIVAFDVDEDGDGLIVVTDVRRLAKEEPR